MAAWERASVSSSALTPFILSPVGHILHTGMTHTHSGFRAASGENPCDPFLPGWCIVRMRVLLTGANGYIGLRLLPELLAAGHHVFAVVRDRRRFPVVEFEKMPGRLQALELDLLEASPSFPENIDVSYYPWRSESQPRIWC